jgi:hypothetical protein
MFTANRLAAIASALTGLAAFVAGLAQLLPGTWPNYALAASGLLVKLVTVVHFLSGSQRYDALTVNRDTALLKALAAGEDIPGESEGVKGEGFVSADEPQTPPQTQAQPLPPAPSR